jgi:predicted nuclease of predicted toxin-antitoxin system
MRLLADENFPKEFIQVLRADGHDLVWVLTDFRGAPDSEIIEICERDSRIVLTLDKDLRQIARQRRRPLKRGGVVLFRGHPATPSGLRPVLLFFRNADQDWTGRVSTIELSRSGQISVRQS